MAKRSSWSSIADYIRESDKITILLVFLATAYGCIAVMSATRYTESLSQFITQCVAGFGGLAVAIIISNFDFKNLLKLW